MHGYGNKQRQQLAVRYPDPGGDCRGGAGVDGGGRCGDGERLPDEEVEETCHEQSGEYGDEEQRWKGLLRNSQ